MTDSNGGPPRTPEEGEASAALDLLVRKLASLSRENIVRIASCLHEEQALGEDLGWWKATMAVETRLRHLRRSVRAAVAAHTASAAVRSAVRKAEDGPAEADLAIVARNAATLARRLVADAATDLSELEVWQPCWKDCLGDPPVEAPDVAEPIDWRVRAWLRGAHHL